MAKEWYLMNHTTLGGYEEDDLSWQRQTFKTDIIDSSMGKNVLLYRGKIHEEPKSVRVVIQDTTSDSQYCSDQRTVLAEIGTLTSGDYIKDEHGYWLVFGLVDNNTVYEKSVLQFCKYIINIVLPDSTTVLRYPVPVENATQYNSGERSTGYITVGASQRILFLPYNDEIIQIDNDYRILMDRNTKHPTAWKVSQVESEGYAYSEGAGLVRWMVVEEGLRETDDIENMLADNSTFNRIVKKGVDPNAEGWGL